MHGLPIIIYCTIFAGCSHLTVAPRPVVAHSVSFSGNVQNGGVIDCNQDGCLVTQSWMEHYRKLEKANKNYLQADHDIKAEGQNWRVSYEVLDSFLKMRSVERGT